MAEKFTWQPVSPVFKKPEIPTFGERVVENLRRNWDLNKEGQETWKLPEKSDEEKAIDNFLRLYTLIEGDYLQESTSLNWNLEFKKWKNWISAIRNSDGGSKSKVFIIIREWNEIKIVSTGEFENYDLKSNEKDPRTKARRELDFILRDWRMTTTKEILDNLGESAYAYIMDFINIPQVISSFIVKIEEVKRIDRESKAWNTKALRESREKEVLDFFYPPVKNEK